MDRPFEGFGYEFSDTGDEHLSDITDAVTSNSDVTNDVPDELAVSPEEPAAEAAEAPTDRPPLFDLIDRQGDPDLPESEKIEPIFNVGSLLRELGVNPQLAEEVGSASEVLRPLGALVLARRPEGDERTRLEGRGAYHENIPVGDTSATVYVKGMGSERAFDGGPGKFTGFPSGPENLFYDELVGHHPRILATETARWGLMEAIDAAYVFAHVAKREGWEHVDQAVEAGVTIPLNVLHQKELSAHISEVLEQYKSQGVHELDQRGVEWEGNKHLATVELIVPDVARVSGGVIEGDQRIADVVGRISDPEIAAVTARTLRALLDAGFCYSEDSAHGQNIYTRGLVAQADNSDLVSLGDYRGNEYDGSIPPVNAQEQRVALLFKQFERQDLMTPMIAPIPDNSPVSWEQVLDVGRAFWGPMLDGVADPEAVDRMVHLLPFMRTEFNVAAAKLLVEGHDQASWETLADHKRAVLAQYEADYGVLSEYEAKVRNNLPDHDSTPDDLTRLAAEGKLGDEAILQYLRTGDEQHLWQNPILGKAIALSEAIENVPDSQLRDWLLFLCGQSFSTKEVRLQASTPDGVTAFEGRQYDVVRNLVENGRLEEAMAALETLTLLWGDNSQGGPAGSLYSLEGTGEVGYHQYTRQIVEGVLPYSEIRDRVLFEGLVSTLGTLGQTGGMSFVELFRMKLDGQEPPFSVAREAENEGYPMVATIVRPILGSYIHSESERADITQWASEYNERLIQLEDSGSDPSEIARAFDELDVIASRVAQAYPELALVHNSYAAGRFAQIDPQRAQAYFDKGMDYYRTRFNERVQLIEDENALLERPAFILNRWLLRPVAERYEELGLPLVARHYGKQDILDKDW